MHISVTGERTDLQPLPTSFAGRGRQARATKRANAPRLSGDLVSRASCSPASRLQAQADTYGSRLNLRCIRRPLQRLMCTRCSWTRRRCRSRSTQAARAHRGKQLSTNSVRRSLCGDRCTWKIGTPCLQISAPVGSTPCLLNTDRFS